MWFYEGREISSIEQLPENTIGFIYAIFKTEGAKFYIGKKNLYSERTKKLTQKELAAEAALKKPGKKKISKKVRTESDWMKYFSSEPVLKEEVKSLGAAQFKRIILEVCYTKKQLTYCEIKHQIKNNVLESANCYNSNIAGTFFRKDIQGL